MKVSLGKNCVAPLRLQPLSKRALSLVPGTKSSRLVQRNSRITTVMIASIESPSVSHTSHALNALTPEQRSVQPSGQPGCELFAEPLCGSPAPLGATPLKHLQGYNFAVYSGSASCVTLCLFTEEDLRAGQTTVEVELDPGLNRTGQVWHICLPRLDRSLLYGYRVKGPVPREGLVMDGHAFNDTKVLLDPYAKAIVGRRSYGELGPDIDYERPDVLGYGNTWPQTACGLPDMDDTFDWEGDRPPGLAMEDLVIYEMHVRGFTQDPSSGVSAPGTYLGLAERLDYLASLGINCIELMPVHEFNELEYYQIIPGTDSYRYNFWGYSTVGFFAPMARFSQASREGRPAGDVLKEFKTLVKEAHKRGMEVIMDVVFNHTAEGNTKGPTIAFRGLDNRVYYMIAPKGETYNYSGCGNTFNCNHPVVRQFVLDSLRYWVEEMHVDGFRFDLASILTRAHSAWNPTQPFPPDSNPQGGEGEGGNVTSGLPDGPITDSTGYMTDGAGQPTGTPLGDPPLIAMISQDPVLAGTKLIAEAWDCDGLNQVGGFPHYGGRWGEWNGTFRDTVRNWIKGTDGWVGKFASAVLGSPEVYGKGEPFKEDDWWGVNAGKRWRGNRGPGASVNFITAHDGFSLRDLVSYNDKHNEANGENNRDGESHNASWNCGHEGETERPEVIRLRQRQMRNFMTALLVSQGVPMITMGDEYGHTKKGNNNTYCHDSSLNWFDWAAARNETEGWKAVNATALLRFTRHLIQFRRTHQEFRQAGYINNPKVQWHGVKENTPDWTPASRLLAYTLTHEHPGKCGCYIAFNTSHLPVTVELPDWAKHAGGNTDVGWVPVVDTAKRAPFDFLTPDAALTQQEYIAQLDSLDAWVAERQYPMMPYSAIVLEWREKPNLVPRVLTADQAGRDIQGLVPNRRGGLPQRAPAPPPPRPAATRTTPDGAVPRRTLAPQPKPAGAARPGPAMHMPTPTPMPAMGGMGAAPSAPPTPPSAAAAYAAASAHSAPAHSSASSANSNSTRATHAPPPPARSPVPSTNARGFTPQELAEAERVAEGKASEMVARGLINDAQRVEAKAAIFENELLKRAAIKRAQRERSGGY